MSTFLTALKIILDVEGGYSDDPNDSGGKTKYGITEAVARAHGYQGDMRDLTLPFASGIYKSDYWDSCKCDKLPWPLNLYVFDAAVNQGQEPAKKMMQQALNVVDDGVIGPATLSAAKKSNDWHASKFMAIRAKRYNNTRGADKFLIGWLVRLFTVARMSNE